MALNGQMLTEVDAQPVATQMPEFVDNHAFESLQDIKFAYCTEFIVKLFDQDKFNDTQIKTINANGRFFSSCSDGWLIKSSRSY